MHHELWTRNKEEEEDDIIRVFLSGFEVFGGFPNNPSYDALAAMLEQSPTFPSITGKQRIVPTLLRFPVEYGFTQKLLASLHEAMMPAPQLYIHVGLDGSGRFPGLVLERRARSFGYKHPDSIGQVPLPDSSYSYQQQPSSIQQQQQQQELFTSLDVDKLAQELKKDGWIVDCSNDAGQYVCEWVYYNSLLGSSKALFVHIPQLDDPYSLQELVKALRLIIQLAVQDMLNSSNQ